jgi:hypothetical protein
VGTRGLRGDKVLVVATATSVNHSQTNEELDR